MLPTENLVLFYAQFIHILRLPEMLETILDDKNSGTSRLLRERRLSLKASTMKDLPADILTSFAPLALGLLPSWPNAVCSTLARILLLMPRRLGLSHHHHNHKVRPTKAWP